MEKLENRNGKKKRNLQLPEVVNPIFVKTEAKLLILTIDQKLDVSPDAVEKRKKEREKKEKGVSKESKQKQPTHKTTKKESKQTIWQAFQRRSWSPLQ